MKKSKIKLCEYCGKIFTQKNKNHKYCSYDCKYKKSLSIREDIIYKCSNCEIEYISKNKKTGTNNFCSKECEIEYRVLSTNKEFECPICHKIITIKNSDDRMFCSIFCQGIWQSKNRVGENASNYDNNISKEERVKVCNYCGKNYEVTKNKIKTSKFCSNECRRNWYSKIWSQSEEWKNKSRIRAVKILESGVISKTNSRPQNIINDMLAKKGIEFENEKGFKYYSVDILLKNSNLAIEVMGDYWHCNYEKYPKIKYLHQKTRINKDRAKNDYLRKNHNLNILYLWESDILNNIELCEFLVDDFIKNNGTLISHHSSKYNIVDENLQFKEDEVIIYMELPKIEILDFLDIK